MCAHLRVHSESYPMNTNTAGFRWFSKSVRPCALGESSHSITRVNSEVHIHIIHKMFENTTENVIFTLLYTALIFRA